MSGILLVILSFCIPAFSASLEALGIEQKKVTVNRLFWTIHENR